MGLITDEMMAANSKNFKGFEPKMFDFRASGKSCRRCDTVLDSVSKDNEKIGDNWLCLDCSAIHRRGDTVVKDWKGKSATFSEAELNVRCEGKECQTEKSELEQIINELVLACDGALLLRGIAAAIRDPLAFEGEKQEYRARYKEIELQIRAAILKANSIKK